MKNFLKHYFVYIFFVALILLLASYFLFYPKISQHGVIKVGILFPTTGPLATTGKPAVKAVLLAIDEINQAGGIDGKEIVPIIYNPGADWNRYASLARHLIIKDGVQAIFGCITSASRKAVKTVVEQYDSLLIYPAQYEGIEDSKNIIYLGAIPNQQIVPAVSLMILKGYKRFYLVGSDYIYPHVANEIIAHEIKTQGGEVVGTSYITLGSLQVDSAINHIQATQPQIIFNTISGEDNVVFFKKLNASIHPNRPPVMSFSISHEDINKINRLNMVGDYFSWTYYPELHNEENNTFQKSYLKKYGSIADVDFSSISAYKGVYLWKQGVEESPTMFPMIVRDFMLRTSVGSPSGIIYIDPQSGHAWRNIIINRMEKNGQFSTVWSSTNPIPPIIYPEFKTRAEWNLFEYKLYMGWENSWEAK